MALIVYILLNIFLQPSHNHSKSVALDPDSLTNTAITPLLVFLIITSHFQISNYLLYCCQSHNLKTQIWSRYFSILCLPMFYSHRLSSPWLCISSFFLLPFSLIPNAPARENLLSPLNVWVLLQESRPLTMPFPLPITPFKIQVKCLLLWKAFCKLA